jgi:hypothetical protein
LENSPPPPRKYQKCYLGEIYKKEEKCKRKRMKGERK